LSVLVIEWFSGLVGLYGCWKLGVGSGKLGVGSYSKTDGYI